MGGRRFLLEVAIGSVDDALAAERGGADRLELNSALELGGLTPSLGSLVEVRPAVSLPIMVMVRPRAGDFVFGSRHFQVMLRDIDLAFEHGADGIVFGILNADGSVNMERCREIMHRLCNSVAVFHRAFDVVVDPFDSLERLIDLGVRRVLTSGQKASAREGAGMIAELIRLSQGRIEVLPAVGINPGTVMEVVERTGCIQVHGSLRSDGKRAVPVDPRDESFGAAAQGRMRVPLSLCESCSASGKAQKSTNRTESYPCGDEQTWRGQESMERCHDPGVILPRYAVVPSTWHCVVLSARWS